MPEAYAELSYRKVCNRSEAGDLVKGIAIASFDKKRGKWGMKAIEAKSVARNHRDFGKVDEEEHDDDW